jgi:hypothetical protein
VQLHCMIRAPNSDLQRARPTFAFRAADILFAMASVTTAYGVAMSGAPLARVDAQRLGTPVGTEHQRDAFDGWRDRR